MGRKKKIENNGGVYKMVFERQIPNTPVTRRSSGGWVNWGQKNNYCDLLLGLYAQSPTLSGAINFCVTALVGGGIDYERMQLDGSQLMPNYQMTWDTFIRKVAFDYFLYGGFSIQIIKNNDGKSYSFYPQDMNTVRCSERDDDGVINSYYVCRDWTNTAKYKPIEIPSLVTRPDGEWNIKRGQPYMFCSDFSSPLSDYYPVSPWISALKAVQAEAEFLSFDLKTTSNVFAPAGALSLPPAESDEAKNAILKNIQSMFSGADGAQQLLITFRNDSDDEPIKFTPFTASSENMNLFDSANQRNINRILETFCITSRALIGLPIETGLASEADIIESSYQLYQVLKGNESRNSVIGVINMLFKANGIDTEIILKPISFGIPTTQTDTEGPNTNVSEDNVQEQKGV